MLGQVGWWNGGGVRNRVMGLPLDPWSEQVFCGTEKSPLREPGYSHPLQAPGTCAALARPLPPGCLQGGGFT